MGGLLLRVVGLEMTPQAPGPAASRRCAGGAGFSFEGDHERLDERKDSVAG